MLTYHSNIFSILTAKQGIKSPHNFIAEQTFNDLFWKKKTETQTWKECFKTQSSKEAMFYFCLSDYFENFHIVDK